MSNLISRDKEGWLLGADGKRLVSYHGSMDKFGAFDMAHAGKNEGTKDAKLGFTFSSERLIAESWVSAERVAYRNAVAEERGVSEAIKELTGDPAAVAGIKQAQGRYDKLPADTLARIEKLTCRHQELQDISLSEKWWLEDRVQLAEGAHIYEVNLRMLNPLVVGGDKGETRKRYDWLRRARAHKHDGLILLNYEEAGDELVSSESTIYTVFNPDQITILNPVESESAPLPQPRQANRRAQIR